MEGNKFTLRGARMLRDLTIAEVAENLKISSTTWQNYEGEKTRIPTVVFLKFCKLVDIKPGDFTFKDL